MPANRATWLHSRPPKNALIVEGMDARARKHYDLLAGLEGLEADGAFIAFGEEFLRGPDGGRKGDLGCGLHAEVEEHEDDEEGNDHDEQN